MGKYEQLYLSSCFERVHQDGFDNFYIETLATSDDDTCTGLSFARAMMHTEQQAALDAAQDYLDRFHPNDPEALGGCVTLYTHYVLRDYRKGDASEILTRLDEERTRIQNRRDFST